MCVSNAPSTVPNLTGKNSHQESSADYHNANDAK